LQARKAFLANFRPFEKNGLSEFCCSNPYPSSTDPEVVFQVKSERSQPVQLKYIKNLRWGVWAGRFTIKTLDLFDDGIHHDGEAGDLVYGNRLSVTDTDSGIIPFCFEGSDFFYPANGFFYINCYRTNTFALNVNRNIENFHQPLRFGAVFNNQDDYFVELTNYSTAAIDLSYCCFQAGEYFQNFLFPEHTVLNGGDTLVITTNTNFADHVFGRKKTVGNFFFNINREDTLKLVSPALTELVAAICDTFLTFQIDPIPVVINEINYHSADSLDSEDWVEFYNPKDFSVDLSGWYFKDEDDNHVFVFPSGSIIDPRGYFVLCRSQVRFHHIFPDVSNCCGDFGFGLSGSGELIRLFDVAGNLIDSLSYDDDPPWVIEPDGSGATLELLHPSLDNALAENWAASIHHGTPGRKNSVYTGIAVNHVSSPQFRICQNYPNPFNHRTRVEFDGLKTGPAVLKVYNIKGQLIKQLTAESGKESVVIDLSNFSSGIYFYQLESDDQRSGIKKAILIK